MVVIYIYYNLISYKIALIILSYYFCSSEIDWMIERVSGKKYHQFSVDYKAYDAKAGSKICADIGGILPEPKSAVVNRFLSRLVLSFVRGFFLGLSDEKTEGTWLWNTDSSAVTYSAWGKPTDSKKTNEPNGAQEENCAAMISRGFSFASWVDVSCDDGLYRQVVCEGK